MLNRFTVGGATQADIESLESCVRQCATPLCGPFERAEQAYVAAALRHEFEDHPPARCVASARIWRSAS
jgi:hypothetical protein